MSSFSMLISSQEAHSDSLKRLSRVQVSHLGLSDYPVMKIVLNENLLRMAISKQITQNYAVRIRLVDC